MKIIVIVGVKVVVGLRVGLVPGAHGIFMYRSYFLHQRVTSWRVKAVHDTRCSLLTLFRSSGTILGLFQVQNKPLSDR